MTLRFVHAADLHLDCPFARLALPDGERQREVCRSTFQAYERIVGLCLEREADFLVVAGDVFDSQNPSLRAQLAFREGLERLDAAGISAYVAHGNHDPLSAWSRRLAWPARAHRFGSEIETFVHERDGSPRALLHGVSYPRAEVRENLAKRFRRADSPLPQIGVLHATVGAAPVETPYAPCTLDDLRAAGLDYWALGHCHARAILSAARPAACYPGNPQGRHANEPGPRGVFVVELDPPRPPRIDFVATDLLRWARLDEMLPDEEGVDPVLRAANGALDRFAAGAEGRKGLVRLSLRGRTRAHALLRTPGITEELLETLRREALRRTPWIWIESLDLDARPDLDPAALREGEGLLADCLRLFDRARADTGGGEARAGLLRALEPLLRKAAPELSAPGEEEWNRLLDEAEALAVDLLLPPEGGA